MTSLPYLEEVSQQIFQIGGEMGREANLTKDKYQWWTEHKPREDVSKDLSALGKNDSGIFSK